MRTHLVLLFAFVGAAVAQTPGLVPLDDLGTGSYSGQQGGLYPGGVNQPPLDHLDRALDAALRVLPRDLGGMPLDDGAIVLLAVGMSNANQEFAHFERERDAAGDRNARVVLLDGAQGGQDAAILADPSAAYWTTVDNRLTAMGLSAAQVQVVWLKESAQGGVPPFPADALELRDHLRSIVQILHQRFPNLALCYLSSRIYGGYNAAGEPKAYDTGFAVKWLIEDQIAGDPALNDGRLPGAIEAPLLLWGPYLWANGPTPRADGLTWQSGDLESDGTHPAPSGEQKVAALLSAFFDADLSAQAWWPRRASAALLFVDADRDAHVDAAIPLSNFGSDLRLSVIGGAQPQRAYIGFQLPPLGGALTQRAKLSLRVPTDALGGGIVRLIPDSSWSEAGIVWSNAPPATVTLANVPGSSRDGTIAAAATAEVNADADGAISLAVAGASGSSSAFAYHARESGEAPRLVLTLDCASGGPPALPDTDGDGWKDACDCDPTDATSFAIPADVTGLVWSSRSQFEWESGAALWGSSTHYDVASGELDDVATPWPSNYDLCVASGIAITRTQETTPLPAGGAARFFLVRATNPCGTGRWTTASSGRDRVVEICP